jgi:hypothetical protein
MQSVGWKADMGRTAHHMIIYKATNKVNGKEMLDAFSACKTMMAEGMEG